MDIVALPAETSLHVWLMVAMTALLSLRLFSLTLMECLSSIGIFAAIFVLLHHQRVASWLRRVRRWWLRLYLRCVFRHRGDYRLVVEPSTGQRQVVAVHKRW